MNQRLLIISIIFFHIIFLTQASAALAVVFEPGTAPDSRPLQPIPTGTAPNISENIQSQLEESTTPESPNPNPSSGNTNSSNSETMPAGQIENTRAGVLLVISTASAVGLAIWYYLRSKEREVKKKSSDNNL